MENDNSKENDRAQLFQPNLGAGPAHRHPHHRGNNKRVPEKTDSSDENPSLRADVWPSRVAPHHATSSAPGEEIGDRDRNHNQLSRVTTRQPLRALDMSIPPAASIVPQQHQQHQQPPVRRALLRYGERFETLFGIAGNQDRISRSYIDDCRNLAENEDDKPWIWRRVLEYASRHDFLTNAELVRLHRRATTRLPASTEGMDEQELDHLLCIWISYAQAQLRQGSDKEARLTMQHIRRWASAKAAFVMQMARMEEGTDISKAMSIIQDGIDARAQPIHDLQQYLSYLQQKARPPSSNKRKKTDQQLSPKRLKTETGKVDVLQSCMTDSKQGSPLIQGRKESIRFRLDPLPNHRGSSTQRLSDQASSGLSKGSENGNLGATPLAEERKTPVTVTQHSIDPVDSSCHLKTPIVLHHDHTNTRPMVDGPSANSKNVAQGKAATPSAPTEDHRANRLRNSGASSIRRPPILSSKLGKARRIDAANGNDGSNDDEDSDVGMQGSVDTGDQSKVAIPKLDLSYILEWDPNQRFNNKNNDSKEKCRKSNEAKAKPSPQLPKIEEVSVAPTKQIPQEEKEMRKETPRKREPAPNHRHEEDRFSGSSSERPCNKHNAEFLPLIEEKNIVRVNGIPYVKLGGPVGKGGSCKVYRALAKDYSVVAIKKVKIGGMDKKAIDSYANEIRLLKSLRGCSTIIQMHDSEVDLQRKAIFVVMELGEADLNHVLQKQTHSTNGGRSLNMNFIRLTWHQMLSAVHCIHEHRIIHGDLKPANFLFVKGTLKLIDFGIAKAIETHDTTNIYRESQIGTLNYMSPEAIEDSGASQDKPTMRIGRASDIWSLGCILYQMVYGKTPFADLHMIQKLQAIINPKHEIPFPETVDALAIDVIKQCLQRRPELRPPIVGKNGLLNEHPFLVTRTTKTRSVGDDSK
ncbi:hypothetical protein ACA910_013035 [Epithemia clementina (nom. ined.)]